MKKRLHGLWNVSFALCLSTVQLIKPQRLNNKQMWSSDAHHPHTETFHSELWTGSGSPSKSLLTSNHHHGHRKDLLSVRGGGDVAKSNGCQAGHGEIQRSDVKGVLAGTPLPSTGAADVVAIRRSNADGQLVKPAVHLDGVGDLIDDLIIPNAVPANHKQDRLHENTGSKKPSQQRVKRRKWRENGGASWGDEGNDPQLVGIYQMQASQWATSPNTQTSRTRTAAPYSR